MPAELQTPVFIVQVCYHPTLKDTQNLSPIVFHAIIHLSVLFASYLSHAEGREIHRNSKLASPPSPPMHAPPHLKWDYGSMGFSSLLPPVTSERKGQRGNKIHINLFSFKESEAGWQGEEERGIFPHSSNLAKVLPDSHSVSNSCQKYLTYLTVIRDIKYQCVSKLPSTDYWFFCNSNRSLMQKKCSWYLGSC